MKRWAGDFADSQRTLTAQSADVDNREVGHG